MDIIVCIKQVPDTRNVKLDPETNTLRREGVESIINPFDMYAVEAALRLKDQHGGTVTAITMGPPQAAEALRQVVEYGVDDVILLSDRAFAGADTWATSYTLARAIQKKGKFDLIVCGKQASDGDTAQVGPGLAEQLDLPFVAFVQKIESLDPDAKTMTVQRLMDDGHDRLECPLPALITVVKEIGELRVPSLRGKMKAKKIEIPVMTAADIDAAPESIGLKGSPTQVVEVFAPQPRGNRVSIEGSPDEMAEALFRHLTEAKVLSLGGDES